MIDYANKFKQVRAHFSVTQEVFGKSIDSTRDVISQIEQGKNRPSLDLVRKIAVEYRIKYEFFFDEKANISECVEDKLFPAHESSASMIDHLGISTDNNKKTSNISDEELEQILRDDDRALKWFNKRANEKFLEFLEKEKKDDKND